MPVRDPVTRLTGSVSGTSGASACPQPVHPGLHTRRTTWPAVLRAGRAYAPYGPVHQGRTPALRAGVSDSSERFD